jgi:hypothetical protein
MQRVRGMRLRRARKPGRGDFGATTRARGLAAADWAASISRLPSKRLTRRLRVSPQALGGEKFFVAEELRAARRASVFAASRWNDDCSGNTREQTFTPDNST